MEPIVPKKNGYDWSDISCPPNIDPHSVVKHEIICAYLKRYIGVLTQDPRVDTLRLNLIDGFAGGGRYLCTKSKNIIPGSPIRLMQTVIEEEAKIKCLRTKPFSIQASYYFSEIDKGAYLQLQHALEEHQLDHVPRVNMFNQPFLNVLPNMISDISSRTRKGNPRNIFLLDQYGYKDVPFAIISEIFRKYPKNTEVVLTFSTDALINYFSDNPNFSKSLERINLENLLKHPDLQNSVEISQSRLLIEQILYEEIQSQCGASFYTPFFIRSEESNRSYWLIHLSSHPKARNEMLLTHWDYQNKCIHHGLPGLNMMLGFDPTMEALQKQDTFDFYFDESADDSVLDSLIKDIPKMLILDKHLSVQDLLFSTCNNSPATYGQYQQALFKLQQSKDISILNSNNSIRRTSNSISLDDSIVLSPQQKLFV